MSAHDDVKQAIDLLNAAGVPRWLLEKWEERAINEVIKVERENRAQQLLPFGREYAASLLDCTPRNVYFLVEKAQRRAAKSIEENNLKVATQGS